MDQAQTFAALALLGVTRADLDRVRHAPFPAARSALEELKERVRTSWKKRAFELHPDRTGNDPEKTALFTDLNQVRQEFDQLQVQPPAPRVMMPTHSVMIQHFRPFTPGVTYTNTSSTTVGWGAAYATATVRPT